MVGDTLIQIRYHCLKACPPKMRSLVICSTCKYSADSKLAPDGRTGGAILIEAMQDVLAEQGRSDISVQSQICLWNCTRPCSVVIRDDERFSYVTGGNEPTKAQAEAILEWFDAHGATETGEVPFKQWPQAMRGHFIARMPPVKL
jgi:predicted metal-binding protein